MNGEELRREVQALWTKAGISYVSREWKTLTVTEQARWELLARIMQKPKGKAKNAKRD
jgi:hypothetical protein